MQYVGWSGIGTPSGREMSVNLFYGGAAPNLAQYTDAAKWARNSFTDIHYTYINLRLWCGVQLRNPLSSSAVFPIPSSIAFALFYRRPQKPRRFLTPPSSLDASVCSPLGVIHKTLFPHELQNFAFGSSSFPQFEQALLVLRFAPHWGQNLPSVGTLLPQLGQNLLPY